MTSVLTNTPFRNVHCINVKSKTRRIFMVNIYDDNTSEYGSTITVIDNISTPASSIAYSVPSSSPSATDNFEAAITLITEYLNSKYSKDFIVDIHNPCNCPFISEADQNSILPKLEINLNVRVN
jgi:hypothetical protein